MIVQLEGMINAYKMRTNASLLDKFENQARLISKNMLKSSHSFSNY